MSDMPVMKFILDEELLELDLSNRFMLTEAIALEEDWGLKTDEVLHHLEGAEESDNTPLKVVLALVWVAKVRKLADTEGVGFAVAAKRLPAANFDINLHAFRVDGVPEPVNPTPPATSTPATRTTRATSAAKRAKRG